MSAQSKIKESHRFKKMVFYENNSQSGRAGLPNFTKPNFFFKEWKKWGKWTRKNITSQNLYRGAGQHFMKGEVSDPLQIIVLIIITYMKVIIIITIIMMMMMIRLHLLIILKIIELKP